MLKLYPSDLESISVQVREICDELRGKRIFVTGGTGFFGMWLLESFAYLNEAYDLRAQAVVLTRNPDDFISRRPDLASLSCLKLLKGDVRSFRFPEDGFHYIIHAATPVDAALSGQEPFAALEIIVEGTRRVLEFAKVSRATRFLLTSSGAVYGRQPSSLERISEEFAGAPDPLSVRSTYGESKRMAEHLCALYHQQFGLQTVIARGFAFLGPHLPLDGHLAIGNFLRDGLSGKPIQVAGDGTAYRSYLYGTDLMVWLWTILIRGQVMRPYNVGSDQGLTLAEVAARVAACVGTSVTVARKPSVDQLPERYVPAIERASHELGLKVTVGLEDAIERTVRWHREHKLS